VAAIGLAVGGGLWLAAILHLVPGLGGGWRIYSIQSPLPRFDPATFELRISGLVEKPQTPDQFDALITRSRSSPAVRRERGLRGRCRRSESKPSFVKPSASAAS
jgi:hypothetical protein